MISGAKWGRADLEREMEKWIEGALKIKVKVKKARRYTSGTESREWWRNLEVGRRREVLRRKKELAQGIFIDGDLTRKEREVQHRLRRIALGERARKGTPPLLVY